MNLSAEIELDFSTACETAETSVLSAMILDPENMDVGARLLKPNYFWSSWKKPVFDCLQTIQREGRGAEAILNPVVLQAKMLELNYGDIYRRSAVEIAGLYDSSNSPFVFRTPGSFSTAQMLGNCQIVVKQAARRAMVKSLDRSAGALAKGEGDFDRVLTELMEVIRKIQAAGARQAFETSEDIANRVMAGPDISPGLATGFSGLDSVLLGGGFQAGDYVVWAARPSKGKTTLTLQTAINMGRASKRILFIPLEMERDQMVSRTANIIAAISFSATQRGYTAEQRSARNRALTEISRWNLNFGTQASVDPDHIFAQAMLMRETGGIDAIIIDQLGLIRIRGRRESRQVEINDISRELKLMSLELKIPVIVPHQLSREGLKEAKGKKMGIEHLRGSDGVGQDADTVLIVQEPDLTLSDGYEIELTVAKQRKGSIGGVRMKFTRSLGRFDEINGSEFFGPGEDRRPERAANYSDDWRSDRDDEQQGYLDENGEYKPF